MSCQTQLTPASSQGKERRSRGVVHPLCDFVSRHPGIEPRSKMKRLCRPGGRLVVIGLVTFCVGCGAIMASTVQDGFVIPAPAQRFTGTTNSDALIQANTLLMFSGTLIRF
jgi:hypothetical protein